MGAVKKVLLVFILFATMSLQAKTIQIPEWYKLNAKFSGYPEVGKTIELVVNLKCLVGIIPESDIKLLLPANWRADKITAKMPQTKQDSFSELKFLITPKDYLSQGAIVIQAELRVPKEAIIAKLKKDYPENFSKMGEAVQSWPDMSKRYTDVSFSILPEESFYPLTGNMWVSYDDTLTPREGFRGPAYYEDRLISAHQAQKDVEMYEKLAHLISADDDFAKNLSSSGVDLNKKEMDYFNGLYVLAVKGYKESVYEEATNFIDMLIKKLPEKGVAYENIKISAHNLRGLIFWAQGQRRVAEDAFKKAFYVNRKHPLQRYVLRNIGLLMVSRRDDLTAEQMYKLSLSYKPGYTLVANEALILSKK